MTPEKIIALASADGLNITLTEAGRIRYSGDQAVVDRWIPLIRAYKPAIVEVLRHSTPTLATTDRQLIEAVCAAWQADADDLAVALAAAQRDPTLIACWYASAVKLGLVAESPQ